MKQCEIQITLFHAVGYAIDATDSVLACLHDRLCASEYDITQALEAIEALNVELRNLLSEYSGIPGKEILLANDTLVSLTKSWLGSEVPANLIGMQAGRAGEMLEGARVQVENIKTELINVLFRQLT